MINEMNTIRWALELCNQQSIKLPSLINEYNVDVLGC